MNKFHRLADILRQWFRTPYFGFVQGHAYLASHDVGQIRSHIAKPAKEIVAEFEHGFASLVGDGCAVSFAAGRMGFYALMKTLDIGPGDEVIVQGATCAVMVNAILRTGATPVYADIDPETVFDVTRLAPGLPQLTIEAGAIDVRIDFQGDDNDNGYSVARYRPIGGEWSEDVSLLRGTGEYGGIVADALCAGTYDVELVFGDPDGINGSEIWCGRAVVDTTRNLYLPFIAMNGCL